MLRGLRELFSDPRAREPLSKEERHRYRLMNTTTGSVVRYLGGASSAAAGTAAPRRRR